MADRGVLNTAIGTEAKGMLRDLADAQANGSMTDYLVRTIRSAHEKLPDEQKKHCRPKQAAGAA